MYFEQFCKERNIKKETIKQYRTTVKQYTEYYDMSLEELIDEAIDEETDVNINKRRRSIKTRLGQFRTHLVNETELKTSTIQARMQNLFTLYSHFDVELPNLPPLHKEETIETTYFDLPTKKQIAMAIEIAGIRLASLILFMASSGTGRTECANLTIGDFIKACSMYHTKENIADIIEELYGCPEPIIPTFYLFRQKTSKWYYTFCTPEATTAILEWLLLKLEICEANDEELTMEDSLWGLSTRQMTYHFSNINDELNFGFKGSYRFFRPHTLRKFMASNIGLSDENIDLLQGRGKEGVRATYIKTNPEALKEIYVNVMENVTIGKITKEIKHEEFTININLNFYETGHSVSL